MKNNQNGFGVIEVLLIIIVISLIAGTGYFVWSRQKDTADPKTNQSTTNTKQDSQDLTKPTASQAYLRISEWGVKIPVDSSIADKLTYDESAGDVTLNAPVTVSIQGTVDKKGDCGFAFITRDKQADSFDLIGAQDITKVGDYYYGISPADDLICERSVDKSPSNQKIEELRSQQMKPFIAAFKQISTN